MMIRTGGENRGTGIVESHLLRAEVGSGPSDMTILLELKLNLIRTFFYGMRIYNLLTDLTARCC